MQPIQPIHFFQEVVVDLLTPFFICRLVAEFFGILLCAGTQFVLNGFDLLLKEIFPLLLVYILLGPHLDTHLDFCKLYLAAQDFQ